MLEEKKIGFIGGGFMAEALIKGLLDSGGVTADRVTVSEIRPERRDYLQQTYGLKTVTDNAALAEENHVVVLAVKPYDIPQVTEQIKSKMENDTLVVSIAAGVKIGTIAGGLSARIVRAMPNTPAQVRQGVTALSFNPHVTDEDKALAREIFSGVGQVVEVDEAQMDAVTGLSGSGPAFIFVIMDAMTQAGVEAGLTLDQARALAQQTIKGAAELAIQTGEHPATLKERITSPKGTTAAGLRVMEEKGVRAAMLNAVAAAVNRSKELG